MDKTYWNRGNKPLKRYLCELDKVTMKKIIFISSLALALVSCVKDTCNGALGNTFYSVEVDSLYIESDRLNVHFSIETLNELPETYFMDIMAGDSVTESITDSIHMDKSSAFLAIDNSVIPNLEEGKTTFLSYALGDRRNYIDCTHSGSNDIYYLNFEMALYNPDDIHIEMEEFYWFEFFLAGHL